MRGTLDEALRAPATDLVLRELFPKRVIEHVRRVARAGASPEADHSSADLSAAIDRFDSEEKCRAYLERLRWPDGVRCPRCDADESIFRIERRDQFVCDPCGYQFSVRVGTMLHGSHLQLWKWLLAVLMLSESRNGLAASQVKETLGVSYKTAWYLCHRIRAAMRRDGGPPRGTSPVRRTAGSRGTDRGLGSYHHVSAKHLPAYVDEMWFRNRNRQNEQLFRDVLVRLIRSESISYAELVRGGDGQG
ncbi:MAG TPA: IS1595 family transposase [Actinomycetota bacterium]|nr:IS1595 family transposase [Actinomycetota bacterium]